METWSEETLNRLWKVFAVSYREREKPEWEGNWQEAVMNRVRSLRSPYGRNGYLELLERIVWRYVPAACILILILATVLFRFDVLSDYSLVQLFVEDALNYSLMDLSLIHI